jgi:hypothetical protein
MGELKGSWSIQLNGSHPSLSLSLSLSLPLLVVRNAHPGIPNMKYPELHFRVQLLTLTSIDRAAWPFVRPQEMNRTSSSCMTAGNRFHRCSYTRHMSWTSGTQLRYWSCPQSCFCVIRACNLRLK